MIRLLVHPLPPLSKLFLFLSLDVYRCMVDLTDGRGGGGRVLGEKAFQGISLDREKAGPSINHSKLYGYVTNKCWF
jgi:hypothetical protein